MDSAVASFQVDSLGRIISASIDSPGSGYNLGSTVVNVANPGNGIGFSGFANTFGNTDYFPLLNKDHLSKQTFAANGLISICGDLGKVRST